VNALLYDSEVKVEQVLGELWAQIFQLGLHQSESRVAHNLARIQGELKEAIQKLMVENLTYQSQLEFQQRRLAALAELDLLNPADQELTITLQRIVDVVAQLMRVTGGAGILLWDNVHDCFSAAASTIPELTVEMILQHMPIQSDHQGDGLRWVLDHAQPLIVQDLPQHIREGNVLAQVARAKGFAAFPLMHQHEVLGVLFTIEREIRELHPDDLHFMQLMSQRAASTVLNSRRVALAQQGAHTDPLTGVYNRRFFDQTFDQHWQSMVRFEPYCMVLLDIDHFKSINDTYGHSVGDEVLQEVAMRIKSSLRKDDLLARYGGEEFAILLPCTAMESAVHVAERLRITLSRTSINTSSGALKITASFGVATYQDWMSQPDLIREADYALYEAKSRGRNCVV
jgi:diguanylate cyclase (GGDEF)-like protein